MKLGKMVSVFSLAAAVACGGGGESGATFDDDPGASFSGGKSDIGTAARLIDSMELNSTVNGEFKSDIRSYGFRFEAKRGARLEISLHTEAGENADVAEGKSLDMFMALYGPGDGDAPGPKLATHEDETSSIVFDVQEDGRYLVAFASWMHPGDGAEYEMKIGCEGTDFQCARPERNRPCEPGQRYIQGAKIDEDTTWSECEVIVLEPLTVAEDITLSIKPGVHVKSNYYGPTNDVFGDVTIQVDGTLQAAGTEEHPIVFTSFVDGQGWGGLVLRGPSHSVSHAVIERARDAVSLLDGTSATIEDVLLEGYPVADGATFRSASGIRAATDVQATFKRALVKHFQRGLNLENSQQVIVEDSVVRENQEGVFVTSRVGQITSCGRAGNMPTVWRDPVFRHSDIVANRSHGVRVRGGDILVQIEKSNIIGNGGNAFILQGTMVHPESYIRESNVFDNAAAQQIRSFHTVGVLDISKNYWKHISDPELSNSWSMRCDGESARTGFSPTPIEDAGPRLDKVIEDVQQQSYQERGLD